MASRLALIANPHDLFLFLEESILRRSGIEVMKARDGEEALDLLAKLTPSFALLSTQLPQLTGVEVCRRAKASVSLRDIPIILVASAGDEEAIGKCHAAGCDRVLTKPINRDDLLEATAGLLGIAARRELRLPLEIAVTVAGDSGTVSASAVDLSASGLQLQADALLEPGDEVGLAFRLPDTGAEVELKAIVRRSLEAPEWPWPRYGVEFSNVSSELAEMLRRVVEGD